jgi:hypothetical protein
MTFLEIFIHTLSTDYSSQYIGIFYPWGEPLLQHLLRCGQFAVVHYGFTIHASHLQQSRLVNNPGSLPYMKYGLKSIMRTDSPSLNLLFLR